MKFIHDSGFEAFSKGTLGNGGQNIYVSKKGVIQRINLLDVNLDGYPDIPLANSHSDNPRVPTEVYALDGSGERSTPWTAPVKGSPASTPRAPSAPPWQT